MKSVSRPNSKWKRNLLIYALYINGTRGKKLYSMFNLSSATVMAICNNIDSVLKCEHDHIETRYKKAAFPFIFENKAKETGLSERAYNTIRANSPTIDMTSIKEIIGFLKGKTDMDILRWKNCGRKTLNELRDFVCAYNYFEEN